MALGISCVIFMNCSSCLSCAAWILWTMLAMTQTASLASFYSMLFAIPKSTGFVVDMFCFFQFDYEDRELIKCLLCSWFGLKLVECNIIFTCYFECSLCQCQTKFWMCHDACQLLSIMSSQVNFVARLSVTSQVVFMALINSVACMAFNVVPLPQRWVSISNWCLCVDPSAGLQIASKQSKSTAFSMWSP